MQIRCSGCHKPFAISREMVHTALDLIKAERLSHYDVHCPHCRRVNHISPHELLHAAPDWGKVAEVSE